jgi:hypothetical protein
MVEYNDEALGAGEKDGGGGEECLNPRQSEYDMVLLQTAVEDFDKNFKEE